MRVEVAPNLIKRDTLHQQRHLLLVTDSWPGVDN